jgi:hypothetical protein
MERVQTSGVGWTARLLIGLALVIAGAAAATWILARYQPAARVLGVVPEQKPLFRTRVVQQPVLQQPGDTAGDVRADSMIAERITQLQDRIQRVESRSEQAQGSAGRADALLIAFAARRAIERGVPLGYLEPLLVDRFGRAHAQAVATIVTASREPVRLAQLIAEYQDLEAELVGPPPNEGMWTGIKRGLSSLISVHREGRPSNQPQARYQRALSHLMSGEVDSALAETMRLPGATRGREWIAEARRYVAARRALDEIESAALIPSPAPR